MRVPSSTTGSVNKRTLCCNKVGIKRGPWTPEEDEVLSNYVNREGEGRWRTLPKRAGLQRCGKSCRLRWMNYLRPSVKRGHIDPDEEDLILRLHRLLGNRWSLIAGRIPGRTDNEIKNYWNTHLSKKLISRGIDPRNHRPLNPSPTPPIGALNNSNFVAISDQPPVLPPHPNALTLEKYSANQHQPISTAGNGNWQTSNTTVMSQRSVGHGSNAGQSYPIDSFNDEDTFSWYLDRLLSDNLPSPYQRWWWETAAIPPPAPPVSTIPPAVYSNGQGGIWDAELVKSALEIINQPDYSK
ncbi:hypothetical protein SAY87_012860 [Trapa incisa]|uniref:Uncharacterized protein n=1 Tax=Trapa incisa TaxID=236973 RepID=A0AAN7GKR4_9MYRT|nr:hypothetical protein SAY87_012860 [Trapa incisa]